jgi:CheY-like chemotaxis protein
MKILIAEDNEINRKVLKAILDKNALQYTVVEDGNQAFTEVQANTYDIIFMDCQMPVMDGYRATELIRSYENSSGKKRCPIIALTANAMAGDRERCLAQGMDDFLAKPFKSQQIIELLFTWTSPLN